MCHTNFGLQFSMPFLFAQNMVTPYYDTPSSLSYIEEELEH